MRVVSRRRMDARCASRGARAPFCGLVLGHAHLLLHPALRGGDLGVRLADLDEVGLHINHRLVEHLLRVLCVRQRLVHVGLHEADEPLAEVGLHGRARRGGVADGEERRCAMASANDDALISPRHSR